MIRDNFSSQLEIIWNIHLTIIKETFQKCSGLPLIAISWVESQNLVNNRKLPAQLNHPFVMSLQRPVGQDLVI
jgi:hypothetical protein